MSEKIQVLKKQLADLVLRGELLYYAMADDLEKLGDKAKKQLKEAKLKLPDFSREYDTWYSEALRVVAQIIPERLEDFTKQYKNERRKEVDFLTYGISDYLIGLRTTRGGGYEVIADQNAALPKMNNQASILRSAQKKFESSLFDIKEVLQADLFDSELEAAKELAKKGFTRGAGAMAGVVLEQHLAHVCSIHSQKSRKKRPTISDFNDMLKSAEIIDTAKWRFIQHLTDIRNLCDHNKDREPTKEEVTELVEGVAKVIKTVF